jgi:hypothetical protein
VAGSSVAQDATRRALVGSTALRRGFRPAVPGGSLLVVGGVGRPHCLVRLGERTKRPRPFHVPNIAQGSWARPEGASWGARQPSRCWGSRRPAEDGEGRHVRRKERLPVKEQRGEQPWVVVAVHIVMIAGGATK